MTAEQLEQAARRMQGSTRVKKSDAGRVAAIAAAMRRGDAAKKEVAWAKQQAKGFLN